MLQVKAIKPGSLPGAGISIFPWVNALRFMNSIKPGGNGQRRARDGDGERKTDKQEERERESSCSPSVSLSLQMRIHGGADPCIFPLRAPTIYVQSCLYYHLVQRSTA